MYKRAFLAAIAVLMMVPALAMAQSSTVVFYTVLLAPGSTASESPEIDATLNCNSGIPLEQTAAIGSIDWDDIYGSLNDVMQDGIAFTITELLPDSTCTVTFGDAPDGWMSIATLYGNDGGSGTIGEELSNVCEFGPDYMEQDSIQAPIWDENYCMMLLIPEPVDFEVTVDWTITPDADPGVGEGTYVDLICYNVWQFGLSTTISTNLYAGPGETMPLALTSIYPQPDGSTYCVALFDDYPSGVETDDSTCNEWFSNEVEVELGSEPACTIAATAWYEGIPTLSQYGMAIMVLLMLGVGLVGFRRFA